jgi:hypothetical protein
VIKRDCFQYVSLLEDFREAKFNCLACNSAPFGTHPDAVHTLPSHFSNSNFNIIFSSCLPFRLPNQSFVSISQLHVCHISRPFHSPLFDHPNNSIQLIIYVLANSQMRPFTANYDDDDDKDEDGGGDWGGVS